MEEVGVVGFIQNNLNKDVQQAGNSSTDPLTPLYDDEATLTEVQYVSPTNCLGTINPKIVLSNYGANTLTSVDIFYHVNGDSTYQYEWTGNLSFLGKEVVELPEISFDVLDENTFHVYTADPNGVPDEFPRNDTIIKPFFQAAITPTTVKLMIRTDDNPEETTWEVVNSGGEVQASGGPYENPFQIYNETIELGDMECYLFKIYDSGGDGLMLPGFYNFYYGSGVLIKNGSGFGSVDTVFFEVNTQVGIPSNEVATEFHMYPNPASDAVNIDFFLFDNQPVALSIHDLAGRAVMIKEYGTLASGPQTLRIITDDLKAGVYLIQARIGQSIQTRKLTVR
jgi:hypothetical protein